ncbi:MAG TPA: hypothetical protein VFA12_20260 [Stellaceae bacterium]|nr:hypothetical protein [Stellaceae bacterium]
MRRIVLAAALFALVSSPAWATVYHVQQTGSDSNPGTSGSPFQHIWKGISAAVAGDTVCVDDTATYDGTFENGQTGGASDQRVVHFGGSSGSPSGTSGNPIKLSVRAADGCAGGNVVTISRLNGPSASNNHVLFYGIEVEGVNYISILGNPLHGPTCVSSCWKIYGGDDQANTILGGGYADNLAACVANPSAFICNGNAVGAYGHHITVEGVEVYFHGSSGIEGASNGGGAPQDYLIYAYNAAHDNAYYSPAGGSGISSLPLALDSSPGMTCPDDTSGNLYHICVVGNWSYNNNEQVTETQTGHRSDGNGIIIGGTSTYTGSVLIMNNILTGNSGDGAHCINVTAVSGAPAACDLVYNTVYENQQSPNGTGALQSGCAAPCSANGEVDSNNNSARYFANILYSKNTTDNYTIGSLGTGTLGGNYNDRFQGAGAAVTGANDITGDPKLTSPGFTSVANFHLQAGSPAIGAAGGFAAPSVDFFGTTRSSPTAMGAVEFASGGTPLSSGGMISLFGGGGPFLGYTRQTVCFTSSATFNKNSDGSNITVEAIGGGGGGAGSNGGVSIGGPGGGGEYRAASLAYASGTSKAIVIGSGGAGGAPSGNGTAGGATTWDSTVVVANGGGGGTAAGAAGSGGSGGTGTTGHNGGSGGTNDQVGYAAAGAGGAGGPHGAGAAGGAQSGSNQGGAGGGASDGGSVGTAGSGINGQAGGAAQDSTAGGTGGTGGASPTAGGSGSHGSGGGGGGGSTAAVTGGTGGAGGNGVGGTTAISPGGGGGGGGGVQNSATGGNGGVGGNYGGGGGAGGYSATGGAGGNGAAGQLCVIGNFQ